MIDIEAERKKLAGELEYLEGFLASVQKKLSNERFVSSAPEKVVANERTKQLTPKPRSPRFGNNWRP